MGNGEGAPIARYDESAESALQVVDDHGALVGDDPFALGGHRRAPRLDPWRAGCEVRTGRGAPRPAGKALGTPAFRLLGLPRTGPPTSWTVWLGDPDDMARRAEQAATSYRRLKLSSAAVTASTSTAYARFGATDLPLMVDVNEWWSLDEALDALPQLAEIGVEYCEQPLRAGDEGGRELKDRSPIPIYVDEDCHTLADVGTCAGSRTASPSSSASPAASARRSAWCTPRSLRMGVMLGCMLEVRPRHRRRVLRRVALRLRGSRREPAPARRSLAGSRARGGRAGPVARAGSRRVASSVSSSRRILVLGEGSRTTCTTARRCAGSSATGPIRSWRSSTRSGRESVTTGSRSSARSTMRFRTSRPLPSSAS